MRFREALQLAQASLSDGTERFSFHLVCGFTPDHLRIFLSAHLRKNKKSRKIEGDCGMFGDLAGNLERLAQAATSDPVVAAIEWSDLDERLGLRRLGGWQPTALGQIVSSVESNLSRIFEAVAILGTTTIVAISMPTLPLPPVSYMPPVQAGIFESRLRAAVAETSLRLAALNSVRLVDSQAIDRASPLAERLNVRQELTFGYPYQPSHASELSKLLVALIDPPAPKKGLITDLDDTFWEGIVGEVGIENVSWDIDHHSQIHGLYQQMLKSLADAGVLIAIASKNDAARVQKAFQRDDLICSAKHIFPMEVNWGRKSASVARILSAWNVGPDSVVFVDDSPLELAEVSLSHPAVECLQFPKEDAAAYALIERLRELFGKPVLSDDDAIRLSSLRRGQEINSCLESTSVETFLSSLGSTLAISFSFARESNRPLELINKTNQFNLNGRRISKPEWLALLADPEAFVMTIGYTDKFGPLGTVAVVSGRKKGPLLHVEHWVMSCRAFSRRIEHATVEILLKRFVSDQLVLDYTETSKNAPIKDYLTSYLLDDQILKSGVTIHQSRITTIHPKLYHSIKDILNG